MHSVQIRRFGKSFCFNKTVPFHDKCNIICANVIVLIYLFCDYTFFFLSFFFFTDGSDFVPVSETLTFVPGQTTASVSVSIVEDSNIEDTEMFSATLTTTDSNVVIGDDDTATVTILDNDRTSIKSLCMKE